VTGAEAVTVRLAERGDLPAIVALLADDPLGKTRDIAGDPLPPAYGEAFQRIAAQSGNMILVAVAGGIVIGCLQLTLIHGLSRMGMTRGQIEAVRVAASARGRGIGELLMRAAIARCRAAGCGLVQLTTDRRRPDAHRFYERLGFVASHIGMKLTLD
jgi:GNAT superfamily N-acetyltransferase